MTVPKRLSTCLALALVGLASLLPAAARADFGIEADSLGVTASESDGALDFQAGSHPHKYTVEFKMNVDSGGEVEGTLRQLIVKLPPGLVGNPLATPRCTGAQFEGPVPACPDSSQVGVARVEVGGFGLAVIPIYNLVAGLGVAASIGFSAFDVNSFQEASLRSDGDYGIDVSDITLPTTTPIVSVSEAIWGVPADPSHDAERGSDALNGGPPVASDAPVEPFLTLPTSCGGPLKTTLEVDSVENPGVFDSASVLSEDGSGPAGMDGCNALSFEPTISSQPTTNLADAPTGLDFNLHQPQASNTPEGEAAESCTRGDWSGEPSEFAFQWLRNGTPIPGASASAYVPTGADESTVLQCEVTATNPAAAGPGRAVSAAKVLAPPPATEPPVAYGAYLTLLPGEEEAVCESYWEGEPTIVRHWFKDGTLIPGEGSERIPYHPADGPTTLQCEAIATNAGGTVVAFSENASSEPPPATAIPNASAEGLPKVGVAPLQLPLAPAHLKHTTVTLPQGMTLNPSAANGLAACSTAEIGYQPSNGEIHFSKDPQSCPNASKVGTLEVNSPLVDHKLPGAVYVAKPYENPFGSLLAIYLAVEDEQTGVIAKLAGKVTPDPQSGQLSARFTDNPQLPLEDIDLHFFGGPQAALKTPLACGTHTTTSTLTPWSTPEGADAHPTSSFQTSVAAAGSGPCPTSEAGAPKDPSFTAGTLAPQAGAYSPFLLKLTRPDGSQQLTGLNATLPKGLTGKLAGIPYCSEAQIAAAKGREAPNQGAVEQASPSCPLASEVGTVTVGAGAGITPLYVTGHAYLAGPYKGAPLSLVIITPAVAGPFDLGAVVVRTALQVNSETAQIHAVSDPLPSIIQGIPLDLRSIALRMDRSEFTLNPTSCDPMAITGAAATLAGQSAALTSPFQVGGCSALKFKPKLAISLKGKTKRTGHPALRAVLTYPKGQNANVSFAQVTLPHSAFLDTTHIKTICTRVQFAADQCPKGAIYGYARAFTPLLDKPVEGPVYLRSSNNKLPDLVAALDGQVDVDLIGRVDTGKGDGIRNTFEAAPDAPVSKFVLEMKGGKKGLLVNSENICSKPQRGLVSYRAHNGAAYEAQPLIKNDCGKKAKKAKKAKKKGKAGR